MNTYTTRASLRRQIGNLFTTDDFDNLLDQALERLVNSGLWKGAISYCAFPTINDYFSLPYPFLSVIGANFFLCPVPVFGQFHDFVIGGPGLPLNPSTAPPRGGIIEDLGDGYATTSDPPTAGSTIYIQTDLMIDNGKQFRVYGISNGLEVFDVHGAGMYLNVNTSETTVFDFVTGLQPPLNDDGSSAMIGGYTLYSVAPDGARTSIGYYYPNQTYPSFRRYRIGTTSSTSSSIPNAVTVLVRKRYIPIFKDTDWVIPGNVGALKFAMQAIDSENSKNSAESFWSNAIAALNQELHATRGSARPEMQYEALGGLEGFGNVY